MAPLARGPSPIWTTMKDLPKFAIVGTPQALFIGRVEGLNAMTVCLCEPMSIIIQADKRTGQVQMSLQPLLIPCKRVNLPSPSMLWEDVDLEDAFKERILKEYEAINVQKRTGIQLVSSH